MKIVIFGYGNTLCSDDGLGYQAAELLAGRISNPAVEIVACQQLSPELVENLRLAGLAIFIDSNCYGAPGELSCCPVSADDGLPGGITHQFQPGALLAMCKAFYGDCPPAYLYSVGAASFDLGESLTPAVQAALPELLSRVEARIHGLETEAQSATLSDGEGRL